MIGNLLKPHPSGRFLLKKLMRNDNVVIEMSDKEKKKKPRDNDDWKPVKTETIHKKEPDKE